MPSPVGSTPPPSGSTSTCGPPGSATCGSSRPLAAVGFSGATLPSCGASNFAGGAPPPAGAGGSGSGFSVRGLGGMRAGMFGLPSRGKRGSRVPPLSEPPGSSCGMIGSFIGRPVTGS